MSLWWYFFSTKIQCNKYMCVYAPIFTSQNSMSWCDWVESNLLTFMMNYY